MSLAVLSINAKYWGKKQFLLVSGCTNSIPYNGKLLNKLVIYSIIWMNLKNSRLSEKASLKRSNAL